MAGIDVGQVTSKKTEEKNTRRGQEWRWEDGAIVRVRVVNDVLPTEALSTSEVFFSGAVWTSTRSDWRSECTIVPRLQGDLIAGNSSLLAPLCCRSHSLV